MINGNLTRQEDVTGKASEYHYDSLNRLSMVEYPGRKEELFYGRAGNRTVRTVDGVEERYRYDRRNRLVSREKGGTVSRYDAEGLRHEMEENGRLVQFIFRDKEVLTEESETGTVRYIRPHELLASDAEHARTYYHYVSDELGSITHVTEGEEVLNRYGYGAWGNITEKEEAAENRFCFAGEQYDSISQQYYLRARFYNPVIWRFTQEDTYRGDGLNLYVYCRNNPVYYVDPSVHFCIPMAEKILAAISDGTVVGQDLEKLKKYLTEKKKLDAGDKLGVDSKKESGNKKIFNNKIEWTATHPKGTGQTYEVYQRNDIDWSKVRTGGDKNYIGKINEEAAKKRGLSPELGDGSFATLHHLDQDSRGGLVEASTRYRGVGKPGQDILHSQYGKNKPNPNYPINRKQFSYDTKEYWKWREQHR